MEEYMKPINKDGDTVLEVECGKNKAMMYVSKLCQGSKGPCILFQEEWLTPNEFQFVSGRQTAKDWKRSIRHHGKSLKLLLNKGLVSVHPPICDCTGCRQASPKVKNRSSHKKRAPLAAITLCEDAQQEAAATEDAETGDEADLKAGECPAARPPADTGVTHARNEDSENKEAEALPPLPAEAREAKQSAAAHSEGGNSHDEKSSNKKSKNSSAKDQQTKANRKSHPSTSTQSTETDNSNSDDSSKISKPPVAVVAPTVATTTPVKEMKAAVSPVIKEKQVRHQENEKCTMSQSLKQNFDHSEKGTTTAAKETIKGERESSSSSSSPSATHSSNTKTEKINKKPSSANTVTTPPRVPKITEHDTSDKTATSSTPSTSSAAATSSASSSSSSFRSPSSYDRIPHPSSSSSSSSLEATPKSGRKSPHYVHPHHPTSGSVNPQPAESLHASRADASALPLSMEARIPRDPLGMEARIPRDRRDEAVISSLSSDYYRLNGYPSPRHLEPNYLSLLHQYSAAHGNYCKWSPTYDMQMSMMPYPVHPASEDVRLYNHYLPTSPLVYDSMYMNPRLCCHAPRPELPPYPYEHLPYAPREMTSSREMDLRERSPSPRRSIKRKACEASAFSCYSPITPHPTPTRHSLVGLDLSVKRPKLDLHRVY